MHDHISNITYIFINAHLSTLVLKVLILYICFSQLQVMQRSNERFLLLYPINIKDGLDFLFCLFFTLTICLHLIYFVQFCPFLIFDYLSLTHLMCPLCFIPYICVFVSVLFNLPNTTQIFYFIFNMLSLSNLLCPKSFIPFIRLFVPILFCGLNIFPCRKFDFLSLSYLFFPFFPFLIFDYLSLSYLFCLIFSLPNI